MMITNNERVGKGLDALRAGLLPFVSKKFIDHYNDKDQPGQIGQELQRILGEPPKDQRRPFRDMDVQALLKVMWDSWNTVFRGDALGHTERSMVSELREVRNRWAHQETISGEDAYRFLDSIYRLLTAVASKRADVAEKLKAEQFKILSDKLFPAEPPEQAGKVEQPNVPSNEPPRNEEHPVASTIVSIQSQAAEENLLLDNLLQALHDFDALRDGDQISKDTVDRVEPVYSDGSIFQRINPKISQALQEQGISSLYEHQAEAISAALEGNNIVLEAPTASGKTLAFAVPMIERLLSKRGGHALMLYPMKAVANDQRQQLFDLLKSTELESWTYDGDTDQEHRKLLREHPPQVLITNPEMLHGSFLAHNGLWEQFLKNLKFVVIDEMHEYRGYFGTNMSLLLRRFAHHLSQIGASPQYFLSTATCANPLEHAVNLTGQAFELVSAKGKFSPKRHFAFIDPSIPDYQFYNIFELRIRNAALACMEQGKAVIVFCPSRRFAEQCYSSALRECDNRGMDKESIALFRAGLSDKQRHEIQRGMRDGSKKIVFSTNALELGIDIGGLDGVILAGFPNTVMSAWQRIGKSGRGWNKDAFVLFYAMNDPVNKFYAANLPAFLKKPLDEIVADPNNEELIENHMPSFLSESGGDINEASAGILGSAMYHAAKRDAEKFRPVKGLLPHYRLEIRGSGGRMWTSKYNNEEIGTMSDYQKFREAYEGAIYLQAGRKYQVDSTLEGSSNEIRLLAPNLDYSRTNPVFVKSLNLQDIFNGSKWEDNIEVYLGKVSLSENLISVSLIDERNDNLIDRYSPLSSSSWRSTSHAVWIDVSSLDEVDDEGLSAFEQLLRVGTVFTIPVDSHDTTTHLIKRDKQIYLIESHPGGIGIVKKAFEKWHDILRTAIGVARACRCRKGCPNCIIPPRLYDEELDKVKGIELAERVIEATSNSTTERIASNGLWEKSLTLSK